MRLPEEVRSDAAVAQRSTTIGKLIVKMPLESSSLLSTPGRSRETRQLGIKNGILEVLKQPKMGRITEIRLPCGSGEGDSRLPGQAVVAEIQISGSNASGGDDEINEIPPPL